MPQSPVLLGIRRFILGAYIWGPIFGRLISEGIFVLVSSYQDLINLALYQWNIDIIGKNCLPSSKRNLFFFKIYINPSWYLFILSLSTPSAYLLVLMRCRGWTWYSHITLFLEVIIFGAYILRGICGSE